MGILREIRVRLCVPAAFPMLVALMFNAACTTTRAVAFQEAGSPPLVLRQPALYPETVLYDEQAHVFLVSSLRDGAIYAVDTQGHVQRRIQDPRLCSVLGFALDIGRGRLWAVNADLGLSVRPSAAGPKQLARVAAYDLATGALVHDVDLAPLAPGPHLLNGLAVDPVTGSAFVTDSFSPVIYRIDAEGSPSVFLRHEAFVGEGINLNGLVVHPDGYLLVIKKSDGKLFKIPLDHPAQLTEVGGAGTFVGGDGVMLVGKNELVIVANQTPQFASHSAFSLRTTDGWSSAHLDAVRALGKVYPTTSVVHDQEIFVLASSLNELMAAPAEAKAALQREATLIPIGRIKP